MQILYYNKRQRVQHKRQVRKVLWQVFGDMAGLHNSRPMVPVTSEQRGQYWPWILGFVGIDTLMACRQVLTDQLSLPL